MIKNTYTFTCERIDTENYNEESRIEVRHNDLTYLPNVVIAFEEFLKGAGFHFGNRHLELIGEEDND
jgi:hypothetical protein